MTMRYIIARGGIIENIIVWDGETTYTPPTDCTFVQAADNEAIGWVEQADGSYAAPLPAEEPALEVPAA